MSAGTGELNVSSMGTSAARCTVVAAGAVTVNGGSGVPDTVTVTRIDSDLGGAGGSDLGVVGVTAARVVGMLLVAPVARVGALDAQLAASTLARAMAAGVRTGTMTL
jgi:hypothetical protein